MSLDHSWLSTSAVKHAGRSMCGAKTTFDWCCCQVARTLRHRNTHDVEQLPRGTASRQMPNGKWQTPAMPSESFSTPFQCKAAEDIRVMSVSCREGEVLAKFSLSKVQATSVWLPRGRGREAARSASTRPSFPGGCTCLFAPLATPDWAPLTASFGP
jgi:hypothetical protein